MGPLIWSRVGVGVLLLLLPLAGALGLLPASMTPSQPAAVAPSGAVGAVAPTLAAAAPTLAAVAPTAAAAVAPTIVAAATTASGAGAAGIAAALPAIAFPSGFRITSPTFPVAGTAAPNSKVEVLVDGKPVGTATAGADGKWSVSSVTLPAGAKEVSVRTVDASGKETGKSAPIALSSLGFGAAAAAGATAAPGAVATAAGAAAAAAPTLAAALAPTVAAAGTAAPGAVATAASGAVAAQATTASGASAVAITFPSGFRITTATFPVSGTAAPNSKVEVMVDGQPVGTATAGADGKWSVSSVTLPAGAKEILARQLDASGKETGKSAPIALSSLGFGAAAAAAGATAAPGGAGAGAAAGATAAPGGAGAGAAAGATAAPGGAGAGAGSVGVIAITFPSGFRITTATLPVAGTAAPNSKVEVMVDGQPVGTATAGADGKWSVSSVTLPAGAKEILARQLDASGKETGKTAPIDLVSLGFVSVPSALPRTGGDGSLMGLVVVVGLLTLGLGLFLRRRSTHAA